MEDMINILVLKVSNVHLKYLNLPLGFNFNENAIWNFILEKKMERCLASWKKYYLSQVGRIILSKVLYLIYLLSSSQKNKRKSTFLSLFSNLVSVVSHIEKLQHNFLWGGIGEEFKFHIVEWNKLNEPLQYWVRSLKIWLLLSSNYIYFFDKQL